MRQKCIFLANFCCAFICKCCVSIHSTTKRKKIVKKYFFLKCCRRKGDTTLALMTLSITAFTLKTVSIMKISMAIKKWDTQHNSIHHSESRYNDNLHGDKKWDTQHNNIWHNDSLYNENQYDYKNEILSKPSFSIMTVNMMKISMTIKNETLRIPSFSLKTVSIMKISKMIKNGTRSITAASIVSILTISKMIKIRNSANHHSVLWQSVWW